MRRLGLSIAALVSVVTMAACGGDSLKPPAANIGGTWHVTLTRHAADNDCSGPASVDATIPLTLTVDHQGTSNTFTVTSTTPSFQTTGTISGSDLSFTAAPTGVFGCTPLTIHANLKLDAGGTTASGSDNWTCANSSGTCGGVDTLTGTLTP